MRFEDNVFPSLAVGLMTTIWENQGKEETVLAVLFCLM
jgi:hypothetical protein